MKEKQQELTNLADKVLQQAKSQGATSAETSIRFGDGLSVEVRMSTIDKLEYHRDQGVGITVYFGQRKGQSNTSDISDLGIKSAVEAACSIAKFTSDDEYSGLADKDLMATDLPDLDLYHPWDVSADEAINIAKECEEAASAYSPLITNADGTSVSSYQGVSVYANSHGFIGVNKGSSHSLSCSMLAEEKASMQRNYWYTVSRQHENLESAKYVGEKAAKQTINRLHAKKIDTCQVPILYSPEMARSLLSHYLSAISGGSLYRKTSFLLDSLGDQVFPDFFQLDEKPLIPKGLGSAAFDKSGIKRIEQSLIQKGCVNTYLLDNYSARKLGMKPTGHGGGTSNLQLTSTGHSFNDLLQMMGTGMLVTELMGSSINPMTGDYSRGASGFWVENGIIVFPIEEVTIADNLKTMFHNIVAIGTDIDKRSSTHTGSILIEKMTIAGS